MFKPVQLLSPCSFMFVILGRSCTKDVDQIIRRKEKEVNLHDAVTYQLIYDSTFSASLFVNSIRLN